MFSFKQMVLTHAQFNLTVTTVLLSSDSFNSFAISNKASKSFNAPLKNQAEKLQIILNISHLNISNTVKQCCFVCTMFQTKRKNLARTSCKNFKLKKNILCNLIYFFFNYVSYRCLWSLVKKGNNNNKFWCATALRFPLSATTHI